MPALISTLGLVPFIVVAILYNQAPNVIVALHYVFMVLIPPYTTMGSLWFITVVSDFGLVVISFFYLRFGAGLSRARL